MVNVAIPFPSVAIVYLEGLPPLLLTNVMVIFSPAIGFPLPSLSET